MLKVIKVVKDFKGLSGFKNNGRVALPFLEILRYQRSLFFSLVFS